MTWILFIIVASYQGPATTAEFSNLNACENAAKNISAIFNKNYSGFDAICVQKDTGETK